MTSLWNRLLVLWAAATAMAVAALAWSQAAQAQVSAGCESTCGSSCSSTPSDWEGAVARQEVVPLDFSRHPMNIAVIQGPAFCRLNADCPAGQVCQAGEFACRLPCAANLDCPVGANNIQQTCNLNEGGAGVNYCSDFCNANWGGPVNQPVCPAGMTCCPSEDATCNLVTKSCNGPKDKINGFQSEVRQILGKANILANKVKGVRTLNEGIQAIQNDFNAKGRPVDVYIIQHGSPGSIKVGEDELDAITAPGFIAALRGRVKSLTLVGCSVGAGAAGNNLIAKLADGLGVQTKAWTDTIWADNTQRALPNKFFTTPNRKVKENPVPVLGNYGAPSLVLGLCAAALVIGRRRKR